MILEYLGICTGSAGCVLFLFVLCAIQENLWRVLCSNEEQTDLQQLKQLTANVYTHIVLEYKIPSVHFTHKRVKNK